MWRPDWDDDVVTTFGVEVSALLIGVGRKGGWHVETYGALCYEKGFVVHFVPVGRGPGRARGDSKFGGADAIIWIELGC